MNWHGYIHIHSDQSGVAVEELPMGGNPAGECMDCYYGSVNWIPCVVVRTADGLRIIPEDSTREVSESSSQANVLNIGLFPYIRHLSHCSNKDIEGNFIFSAC